MSNPVPQPVKQGINGVATADGRQIELSLSEQKGRALSDILKADTVVSGRVVERFQGDTYLINIRGQHIVAESSLALLRDSVVKLAVLSTDSGLRLRIAEPGLKDQAQTSAPNQRLLALGLPNNPTAQLVLQSFEDIGAQLTPPQRVQQAFLQVAEAQQAGASPAQQVQLAKAHALLAEAKLPASPALIQVAQRAVQGNQLPIASLLLNNVPEQGNVITNQSAKQFSTVNLERDPKSSGSTQNTNLSTGQTNAPQPTTSNLNPDLPIPRTTGTRTGVQLPLSGVNLAAAGPQSTASTQNGANPLNSLTPNTASGNLHAGSTQQLTPSPSQQLELLIAQHDLAHGPKIALRNSLEGLGISLQPDTSVDSEHQLRPTISEQPTQITSNQQVPTYVSTDQSEIPQVDVELGTLLRRMVDITQSFSADSAAPSHTLAREILSESLLPPRALADYDLVIPFPLFAQQQPVPARLAMSSRKHGTTEATFMRIDVELSKLGPLSLRFTEVSGNPIGITVLHTPQAHSALHSGIHDLEADLQSQGLEASVRLADYSEAR